MTTYLCINDNKNKHKHKDKHKVNIECPISVICIQESRVNKKFVMSQFLLPNYSLTFENR